MFEEIAVWKRVGGNVAIRYVGFRNLETGSSWIAFANYLGSDDDEHLTADHMVAPEATIEAMLHDLPASAEFWKPTLSEAVTFLIANNRDS